MSRVAVKCRSLTHKPRFEAAAAKAFGGPKKADEALNGITFLLARRPTLGTVIRQVGNPPQPVYALKTERGGAWREVIIIYTATEDEVVLWDLVFRGTKKTKKTTRKK